MKTKIIMCYLVLMFSVFAGSVWGGDETGNTTKYGFEAGLNNTGSYNSFYGYRAGYQGSEGYNTAVGMDTGHSLTTGQLNTIIGMTAGYSSTTGIGNVFIGYQAGYNETGNNKLYIANSSTATPLIWGDFSTGTVKVNGAIVQTSSREYKEDIKVLSAQAAFDALEALTPVTFVYKSDRTEQHVGFIAEDVPDLVATQDHKSLSSMDIVSVLTKVVQEQQGIIERQQAAISAHSEEIAELKKLLMLNKN